MIRNKTLVVFAALALVLALAAPAANAQSSQDGYTQQGPSVLDRTVSDGDNPPAPPPPEDDTGEVADDELPFTGLDIGLVAVAGASLMLLGVGMRRLTRAPDSV